MSTENPATPAQAATPGSDSQNGNQPPVTPSPAPTNGNQGNQNNSNQEGVVTIPLKEYRDLQRNDARAKSFDKRIQLQRQRPGSQAANPDDGNDPELVQKYNEAETARQAAERRALQAEIRGRVRDVLDKEEFKALPKSTRELILKNPGMLTEAETLEEAILDIEDFVRDQVISLDTAPQSSNPQQSAQPQRPEQPAGHDAPPSVSSGAPASGDASGMEDTSKLSGPSRSQATLRNLFRKSGGVKQV